MKFIYFLLLFFCSIGLSAELSGSDAQLSYDGKMLSFKSKGETKEWKFSTSSVDQFVTTSKDVQLITAYLRAGGKIQIPDDLKTINDGVGPINIASAIALGALQKQPDGINGLLKDRQVREEACRSLAIENSMVKNDPRYRAEINDMLSRLQWNSGKHVVKDHQGEAGKR